MYIHSNSFQRLFAFYFVCQLICGQKQAGGSQGAWAKVIRSLAPPPPHEPSKWNDTLYRSKGELPCQPLLESSCCPHFFFFFFFFFKSGYTPGQTSMETRIHLGTLFLQISKKVFSCLLKNKLHFTSLNYENFPIWSDMPFARLVHKICEAKSNTVLQISTNFKGPFGPVVLTL